MTDLSPGAVVRVVNPSAVVQIASPGLVQGLVLKEGAAGVAGRSITDFERTAGDGSPGTTDTYTVTFNDATTYTFEVYNGTNGPNGVGVPPGGASGQLLRKNSGTDYDTGWVDPPSGGGGGLLATATLAGVSVSTTSGTLVDVDPALAVTFTAPATGSVVVRLTGMLRLSASGDLTWGIRSGTTTIASGRAAAPTANYYALTAASYLVTGLTPGASYTYKWAHARTGGTGTAYLETGGAFPPAVMEVLAA